MREFNNPELKRSSLLIGIVFITFLLLTVFCFEFLLNQVKADYVERMGAVVSIVVEKAPMAKQEVMAVVAGELKVDGSRGIQELNAHGIDGSLQNSFFPGVDRIAFLGISLLAAIVILAFAAVSVLNYFQYKSTFRKIRKVIDGARAIMDGNISVHIDEEREGDFSRLAVAFNSMGSIIRENITQLEKEKEFLADILSDISHQLKTPIASMMIYNDILSQGNLAPEKQAEFLENNLKQLERMSFLIKSLLKLAKLDAGAIVLSLDKKDIKVTLNEAIVFLESQARESGVKINVEGEPAIVSHDVMWLGEAFTNLIKNAIEHTSEGGLVTVQIEDKPMFIKVWVKDDGVGIDEKDLPHIFKRFYKAGGKKNSDSVGIGLAIAKSIIEQHGGMITVESLIGEGTKFEVTFLKNQ